MNLIHVQTCIAKKGGAHAPPCTPPGYGPAVEDEQEYENVVTFSPVQAHSRPFNYIHSLVYIAHYKPTHNKLKRF